MRIRLGGGIQIGMRTRIRIRMRRRIRIKVKDKDENKGTGTAEDERVDAHLHAGRIETATRLMITLMVNLRIP